MRLDGQADGRRSYLLMISAMKTRSSVFDAFSMPCFSPSAQNVVAPAWSVTSRPLSL